MEQPIERQTPATSQSRTLDRASLPGQVVLVLQGGGALGSYQAGVYQALHEAGVEPDWIVGTSIGAINASLIAGNAPQNRLARLIEFWSRSAAQLRSGTLRGVLPGFGDKWSYWTTLTHGIPGFFTPNPLAHAGDFYPLGADRAGYYSTAPLEATLAELVDFNLINQGNPRLTVGAAHVRTSQMTYFDSRRCKLDVKHIMASGALPPAFPAVRVDGELYWDGGILSNTPTEVVLDDNPRRDSLIFTVHLWNPVGAEPSTMAEVLNRHKDVQYSSRIASQITRHQQTHRLRHVINELAARLPETERDRPGGARTDELRLPDPDARGAAAGAATRSRRPHQGRRFQPFRHSDSAGTRATPTPRRCLRASPGSANSIRFPG